MPVLREVVEPRGVTVVEGDALRSTGRRCSAPGRGCLVANLPYNVATPLVLDLLDEVPAIERMLVMVQREVGERLAAGAGDDAYGAVSVKVAYWATAEVVGTGAGHGVRAAAQRRVGAGDASTAGPARWWSTSTTADGCSR